MLMFSKSRNPLLTFLLSYHVWVTSKIQVNFRFERYWWFCHKFLKFSHFSCFRGQGIHCWYFYRATLFGLPRKSRSTSGSRVTQRCWWLYLMNFNKFFTIHVIKVEESIADIPTELPCLSDLGNPSQLLGREVLRILSYKFLKFSHYSCFRGQGIHFWYFYRATMKI